MSIISSNNIQHSGQGQKTTFNLNLWKSECRKETTWNFFSRQTFSMRLQIEGHLLPVYLQKHEFRWMVIFASSVFFWPQMSVIQFSSNKVWRHQSRTHIHSPEKDACASQLDYPWVAQVRHWNYFYLFIFPPSISCSHFVLYLIVPYGHTAVSPAFHSERKFWIITDFYSEEQVKPGISNGSADSRTCDQHQHISESMEEAAGSDVKPDLF